MAEFAVACLFFLAPLVIAAAGSLMAELSGRTNMALEGLILTGAFSAAAFMSAGCGAPLACILAMLVAGLCACLLSLCVDRFGTDPIMAGLAANLVAQAGTDALSKILFGSQGILRLKPSADLSGFGGGFPATELAAAGVVFALSWIFLSRTRGGLRLRAVGSNPEAARASGVDGVFSHALAFALSGLACGLSGALAVQRLSAWSPGMTFGKGWLALAAMYVGRSSFPGILASCALFSMVESLANSLQGQALPQEWSLAFPYLATLVFMALAPRRKKKSR